MYLLDTNVVSELRKAKTGKINRHVKAWAKRVVGQFEIHRFMRSLQVLHE